MALTRIVVAHRPETIHAAERVITLEMVGSPPTETRQRTGMSIRLKIILYQAIVALMLVSTAVATYISIDRIDYYFDRTRLARQQMDTVDPAVGAHEPLLGEHRRDAAARTDRARRLLRRAQRASRTASTC